jgi:phage terminase large subunit-like protein
MVTATALTATLTSAVVSLAPVKALAKGVFAFFLLPLAVFSLPITPTERTRHNGTSVTFYHLNLSKLIWQCHLQRVVGHTSILTFAIYLGLKDMKNGS